jgi:hypothetical protein
MEGGVVDVSRAYRCLGALLGCCSALAFAQEGSDAGAGAAPPVPACSPEQGYRWQPAATASVGTTFVEVGGHGWFGEGTFALMLDGGALLVGYRTGGKPPKSWAGSSPVGLLIRLPRVQGEAVFSADGLGTGCVVEERPPGLRLAAEPITRYLNATVGWRFEVRSKDKLLLGPL